MMRRSSPLTSIERVESPFLRFAHDITKLLHQRINFAISCPARTWKEKGASSSSSVNVCG
eukprot:m.142399 g.142399  ORF g.142399 m.142399 type:complete len:60 (+) comp15993_c0_seq4:170-349(+)